MIYSGGNALSIVVFFLWVPVALWGAYKWPSAKAAALLLLLPLMFLPERVEFNLQGLPNLGKKEIAVIWLFIGALLFHHHRLRKVQLTTSNEASILLLLGGYVVTILLNRQPVSYYLADLPGHSSIDVLGAVIGAALNYVLPFVLGAAMFRNAKDLHILFRLLAVAAIGYGVLQLIEVALSPQLNTWVYGFFQHDWVQMKRGEGFRPIVFMSHALAVAMFTMIGLTAAARLYKAKTPVMRLHPGWALAFLGLVVVLNKSAAPLVYALVGLPLVLFATPKTQFGVAKVLAICVLLYPAVRAADLVPTEKIADLSGALFGDERARSLNTRFVNEAKLLERASERPFFGWGGYGRSFIHDPRSGRLQSIADGEWIVTLGKYGIVGFLGKFLLLVLPIFLAAREMPHMRQRSDRRFLAALALIVAFSTLDLIPNSASHYLPFVFAGALVGCSTGVAGGDRPATEGRWVRAIAALLGWIAETSSSKRQR